VTVQKVISDKHESLSNDFVAESMYSYDPNESEMMQGNTYKSKPKLVSNLIYGLNHQNNVPVMDLRAKYLLKLKKKGVGVHNNFYSKCKKEIKHKFNKTTREWMVTDSVLIGGTISARATDPSKDQDELDALYNN